jgi:hypothetical protein
MSVGHRYGKPDISQAECERILGDPRIKARLAQKPRIDRNYDIPYLAGYSQDGKTIYVDREFPVRGLLVGRRVVNVLPFLVEHEKVEKAVIDVLGKPYSYAHAVATHAEEKKALAAGYQPREYEKAFEPYIKKDARKRIQRTPADLDLTPYRDEQDNDLIGRKAAGASDNSALHDLIAA